MAKPAEIFTINQDKSTEFDDDRAIEEYFGMGVGGMAQKLMFVDTKNIKSKVCAKSIQSNDKATFYIRVTADHNLYDPLGFYQDRDNQELKFRQVKKECF